MTSMSLDQALLMGLQFHRAGNLQQAENIYKQILKHDKNHANALQFMGMILEARGDSKAAMEMLRKSLKHQPKNAQALSNLGTIYLSLARWTDAEQVFKEALKLEPQSALVMSNLGTALKELGKLAEAEAVLREAIAMKGNMAEAHNNLGSVLRAQARSEEAVEEFRIAVRLDPSLPVIQSGLVYAMLFLPELDLGKLRAEHERWNELYGKKVPAAGEERFENDRTAGRRLKVGYVSPDLRQHSVAYFLLPLLTAHDRARVHVMCYSTNPMEDAVTKRIQQASDAYLNVTRMKDAQLAMQIRNDRIDVLVDLAGHTAGGRPQLFARRAAPVQVSYLGYPGTTGIVNMDYRLSDAWADPEGAEDASWGEEVVRLPRSAWCFQVISGSPEVGDLPADAGSGGVTFGTFNAFHKTNERILGMWAEILRRVPGSKLLVKNEAMRSEEITKRLRGFFEGRGIGAERLELAGKENSFEKHLGWYGRVDIGLDTYPYHGTTTTSEALWMGVPVVTLAGKTHAARVGASLLHSVGLDDWVARSEAEYVELAVRMAGDLGRLREIRRGLRERMRHSALMDGAGFAREVEGAYRQMWEKWCASGQ